MKQEDFCRTINLSTREIGSSIWGAPDLFYQKVCKITLTPLRDKNRFLGISHCFSGTFQKLLSKSMGNTCD